MNIRNRKELKTFAAQRLSHSPQQMRITVLFSALTVGISILSFLISYVLQLRMDQSGGLSNMGTRAVLSTLQTVLPLVISMVMTCLEVGYLSSMLRIARGQYASPNGLRLGFDRFWVLLRSVLLQSLVLGGIGFLCIYASVYLFVLSPLSRDAMEILMPLAGSNTLLSSGGTILLDDATYLQLMSAMTPMLFLFAVLYSAIAIPVLYGYRMVNYIIVDKPGMGAWAALKESRRIMKHNRVSLFRLDLSLWPYYLALLAVSIVCYGDQILPLLGIRLPFSAEIGYILFYVLYLAGQFAVFFFLRSRVEVTYALAYDSIKPEEKTDDGVVLGNIFQM